MTHRLYYAAAAGLGALLGASAAASWLRGPSAPDAPSSAGARDAAPAVAAVGERPEGAQIESATDAPSEGVIARPIAGGDDRPVSRGLLPDGGRVSIVAAGCPERLAHCETEHARLAREAEARRADEIEERGEPVPMPSSLPPRLGADAVRAAVSTALVQAHAEGRLEDLDCTEYPCIAFGRLRGDEEDMERVERSRALAPYRDDVLTMLFWAQSDEHAPRDRPRETGLFAIAFYTAADREAYGDRLDRRIRVRTVELWNTVRPGW